MNVDDTPGEFGSGKIQEAMLALLHDLAEEALLGLFVRLHGDLPPETDGRYRFPRRFVTAHKTAVVREIQDRCPETASVSLIDQAIEQVTDGKQPSLLTP
jgi:hypothetical protein